MKPKDAKTLGMTRSLPLRPDWEQVKEEIMHAAMLTKFQTHPKLADLLRSTGHRIIVENAPTDDYWGCGPDGQGLNRLGQLLMTVRAHLRGDP